MRVLIFSWKDISAPAAGGAEVFTHRVAREWIAMGHEVSLFCARWPGAPEHETVEGVEVTRRGGRFGVYREARRFYEALPPGRFDLVIDEVNTRPFHCHRFVRDVPVVALIFQVAREVWWFEAPLVPAAVGRYVLEPLWLRDYRDVPTLTISQSSKRSLEAYGLRDVRVIPVGLDVGPQPAEVPKESDPTIVYVGRLAANKRPDHAIAAFRSARRHLPNLTLWIIGSGPLERKLRRNAPPGVRFFGRVSDVEKADLVRRAHALVVTSVREGWGMVVSEAAALGTPAIAYPVPGLIDSVTASGGELAAAATPAQLSEAIVRALPRLCEEPGTPRPTGTTTWSAVADVMFQEVEAMSTTPTRPRRARTFAELRRTALRPYSSR